MDTVVHAERVLPAAPSEVFAAFEDPKRLARWWGPDGFTSTFEMFEFRPEGRWAFTMHGPNGANFPNESIFRVVEPDARIVLDHIVQPLFTLTVTLTPRDEGTHLTWDQDFKTVEVADRMRPLSQTANEQVLDRLQAEVSGSIT